MIIPINVQKKLIKVTPFKKVLHGTIVDNGKEYVTNSYWAVKSDSKLEKGVYAFNGETCTEEPPNIKNVFENIESKAKKSSELDFGVDYMIEILTILKANKVDQVRIYFSDRAILLNDKNYSAVLMGIV